VAGLRAALEEAQLRSLQNQRALREAGARGQNLLAEERALRQRLEDCRAELHAGRRRLGADEGGDDDDAEADRGGRPPVRTSGGSAASLSAASSPGSRASGSTAAATEGAQRGPRFALQAEKQRLLEQNLFLTEELEEQEREVASPPLMCRDASADDERTLVSACSSELADEIADATAKAASAERKRVHEHDALLQQLSEAQGQACSMLCALERQLESAQSRNALLRAELSSERSLRTEHATDHHEVMDRLQLELDGFRRKSHAAEEELLQLERRLSAREGGQAEEALSSESTWGELPMVPTPSESLCSEWRSADDALRPGRGRLTMRQGSISSLASESWDGLSFSEADAHGVPSPRRGARVERRRLRARVTHRYRELGAPVTVELGEPEADANSDGSPSSWSSAVRKTLTGTLW